MVGLVVELELALLVGHHIIAFLVQLFQLADLLELFAHVLGNQFHFLRLSCLLVRPQVATLSVYQLLEVFVPEALHQVELVLENHHAVVHQPPLVLRLAPHELTHLPQLLEKGTRQLELAIETHHLQRAVGRVQLLCVIF